MRPLLIVVLASSSCGGGPSGEPNIASPDLVVLSQSFVDDVTVMPDRLLVPTAGHEEELAKISAGKVLVARRNSHDDATKNNANGFLRRVTAVMTVGGMAEIDTTAATLE